MATIDQQFVEYIVKTLVNNPDKVQIDRQIDEKGVLLSLTVDPEDVGRVIGRRGATAQSIRTLLRALGTKNDARYNLKIVNTDEEGSSASAGGSRGLGGGSAEPERHDPVTTGVVDASHEGDGSSADATTDTTAEEILEEEETLEDNEPTSELAEKTRAELADYDDLDI